MENKVIIFLLASVLITSCNKHADCEVEVDQVCLKNFNNFKIDKIYVEDIGNKTNSFAYFSPKLIPDNTEISLLAFELNQQINNSFKKGINITINDTMKYKIDEIQMEEVDSGKKTMWGTIYGCFLQSYKLNDSLIESHADVIIFK